MIKLALSFLIMFFNVSVFSQKIVTGNVTDKTGTPIPGVNVLIKGTNSGTTTDYNGTFELTISPDSATLVFQFIGYHSKEYTVISETHIQVALKEECIACYFDLTQMRISLSSGVVHSPWGGKMDMNIPLFLGQRALKTGYEYQSDLSGNYQVNSAIGVTHLFHNCYYHLEVNLLYSKINIESTVPYYRSYLGEVALNLDRSILFLNSSFYLGAGTVRYSSTTEVKPYEERGYLIGYGTYIPGALRTEIIGKVILWEEFNQYNVELKRRFKKWDASLQWNHFSDYHEINARVGIRFSYGKIFRKRK